MGQDVFDVEALKFSDLAISFGDVGGHERIVDVEFGDEDSHVELFNFP